MAAAIESVQAQSVLPREHLIGMDWVNVGAGKMRNQLAAGAQSEWLAFLDDDDVLLPNHLKLLLDASEDADVVFPMEEGKRHICSPGRLTFGNTFAVTCMVRKSTFDAVGGFPASVPEDWALWLRLRDVGGARFRCVHEVTWVRGR